MKNKNLTIILIILLSIVTISLSIILVNILTNRTYKLFNFRNNTVSNELVIDKTYETIFDSIEISADAGDIEIKIGNDKETKIVIYGDKDKTKIDTNNEKLYIESQAKTCIGFCFNNTISKTIVYLPSNYDKNLKITNKYGDIDIDAFSNMTLDVTMNAGDINVISVNKGTINNDYGDIKISRYAEDLDINEKCGDVYVGEVNDIKVKNNYGDININKVNNSLNVKEDCGDVEINSLSINIDSFIENSFGDIEIGSTNEIYIDAKTSLGDTKINNNYRESDVTITINNSCGDIEINN